MTKRSKLAVTAIIAISAILAGVLMIPKSASYTADEPKKPTLSHQQELWLNVLEWCESRGDPVAVNPIDLDNTPSYGAFQFKPSTLDYYAEKYDVATTTLMDYETQRSVVTQMILHRDEINWNQQFPWCVKKFGLPPKS